MNGPPSTLAHGTEGVPLVVSASGERARRRFLERAQAIAAHANARTTALYDHSEEKITAAELERVGIRKAGRPATG